MDTFDGLSVPLSQLSEQPARRPWNLSFPNLNKDHRFYMECNVIASAQGSAYVQIEKTKVICAVIGPREAVSGDEKVVGDIVSSGTLEIRVRYAPFSCAERLQCSRSDSDLPEELMIKRFISIALNPIIRFELYPKCKICIHAHVLEDDGYALTAALNGIPLALATAGIEMYDLVTTASSNENGVNVTVSWMNSLEQIAHMHVEGSIDERRLSEVVQALCHQKCRAMKNEIRKALLKHLKNIGSFPLGE